MILKKELIQIGLDCPDADSALREAARAFVDNGFATEGYPQAIIDREQVVHGCRRTGIQRTEPRGKRFRRHFADVADAQRNQKPLQPGRTRTVDRRYQICGGFVAHPVKSRQILHGQRIQVRRVVNSAV